ncbi:MAG TPA: PAS domain-containing protein [Anaerolineae bacterium]|jgi:PAS domain-containing protein|nr:PAS domain-containing protein [Anaerolineae bacterium]
MGQQEIELILSRHWASYLNTPVFLVDPDGNLLFYNESAELVLGRRFAETGKMSAAEWSTIYQMRDEDHKPIPPEDLPLTVALREHRPVHMRLWMIGLDHIERHIQTTCLPLIVEAGRFLGAIAIFWEIDD